MSGYPTDSLPSLCQVFTAASTMPHPSGQADKSHSLWRQPGCLSTNWRRDGMAECRWTGSLPPGVCASPLWHARHPLAWGPWPAILSQCSHWVCHPADSVVTLLQDTDLVPRAAEKISYKPFDHSEWGVHSTSYEQTRWINSSSFIFATLETFFSSCPSLLPLDHTALALRSKEEQLSFTESWSSQIC